MENIKELIDYGVIGLLLAMSFVALWFFLERCMFYAKVDITTYKNKKELELDLGYRLSTLATIGSNAPYIGLLGTVLGIMVTFYSLGDFTNIDTQSIMTSLALALKATALGLVVAIPCIVFYNYLVRKMEVLLTKWDIANEKV